MKYRVKRQTLFGWEILAEFKFRVDAEQYIKRTKIREFAMVIENL